ncbi:MAG: hypothetical protein IPI93_10490 [Sphingobacteriaceae bacterium]|nr:hypothetical protein [Sphingobacteriaceae bacterium]
MDVLLTRYHKIAAPNFFTDLDNRWNEFSLILQKKYDQYIEENVGRKKGITFINSETNEKYFLSISRNSIYECYLYRQHEAEIIIRKAVRKSKNEEQFKIVLKIYILELESIRKDLEKIELPKRLEKFKVWVLREHIFFISRLKQTYLSDINAKELRQPRLKWLGQVNQLGTLFYDLLKGSNGKDESGKQQDFPPLISASIEDLMALIENNFVDKQGKPFSHSFLQDLLSSSKNKLKYKASGEKRILLKYI